MTINVIFSNNYMNHQRLNKGNKLEQSRRRRDNLHAN